MGPALWRLGKIILVCPDLTAMTGPHFICIGAQRAGTTWLYTVLDRHTAFWLPPIKELHYFDDPLRLNRTRYYQFMRMRLVVGARLRRPLTGWDVRYFFSKRSDAWYRSLFAPARTRGLIGGEFTPTYATLDEAAFRRMRNVNPAVKFLFIMRDPIMRSWSSIMKSRKKHGANDVLSTEAAIAHANRTGVVEKSSYVPTIEKLERVFPREQIHYAFFDDIASSPKIFLARILSFLGVDPLNPLPVIPAGPVGSSAAGMRPPVEFERHLAAQYLDDVCSLCQRFDGPPHLWRARYESLVRGSTAAA
jgi:hypothetical protein